MGDPFLYMDQFQSFAGTEALIFAVQIVSFVCGFALKALHHTNSTQKIVIAEIIKDGYKQLYSKEKSVDQDQTNEINELIMEIRALKDKMATTPVVPAPVISTEGPALP